MEEILSSLRIRLSRLAQSPIALSIALSVCSLLLGVALAQILLQGRPGDGAYTHPPVVAEAWTGADSSGHRSIVEQPQVVEDWADSVPMPILGEYVNSPGVSRAYRPIGSGIGPVRESGSTARRTIDPATVRAVAILRVSGSKVAAFDVGLGPSTTARPADWILWSTLGDCSSLVRLPGPWPAGHGEVRSGNAGEWLFRIAVPEEACRSMADRVASSRAPTAILRRELAYAVQTSPDVRAAGAPLFREGDLRELATIGDTVWGVFRGQIATTRIYPPPPRPQLAFVAVRAGSGEWQIRWSHYVPDSTRSIGLAGVVDLDDDGRHEAFFGVRNADGHAELLQVNAVEGTWRQVRRIPLGRAVVR